MGLGNKKGFEMAITTLVAIALGVMVLIALALAFTGGFEKFWNMIKGYSPSDIDAANNLCETQCNLGNGHDFCCEDKQLGKLKVKCLDERLDFICKLDCLNVNCEVS